MRGLKEFSAFLLFTMAMIAFALATVPSKPYTFVSGTQAQSAQVNADFDTLYSVLNAGLDSTNVNLTAGIGANYIQSNCGPCTGIFKPGAYTFTAGGVGSVPLAVNGVASQTADLFDVLLTAGGNKAFTVGATGNPEIWGGNALRVTSGQTANSSGDAMFGLTSTGLNNPYVGCAGTGVLCKLWFYTAGTGSAATASIDNNGAPYFAALAPSQCVGTNASSVLATTGGPCVSAATTPLSLTAGNMSCPSCVTSVSAGSSNVVIGGTATAPTVNLATNISPSHVTVQNTGANRNVPAAVNYDGTNISTSVHIVPLAITVTLNGNCAAFSACALTGNTLNFTGGASWASSVICVPGKNGTVPDSFVPNINASGGAVTVYGYNASSGTMGSGSIETVAMLCLMN